MSFAARYLAQVRQDDEGLFVVRDLEEHVRVVRNLVGAKEVR